MLVMQFSKRDAYAAGMVPWHSAGTVHRSAADRCRRLGRSPDHESPGPWPRGAVSQPLVLSLFPGIGLLDMAFESEGFCVVRGPDLLWGGDVRSFHVPYGRFDGVIGGPPCQI